MLSEVFSWEEIHKEKIIKMAESGYYRTEIAKELNINVDSLRRFLIDEGIFCEPVPYSIRTEAIRKSYI